MGHLLPGTRDYDEAVEALRSGKKKIFIYESYQQVLQKNILIQYDPDEDAERVAELAASARALAALLEKPSASTVPGIYFVHVKEAELG
jgi:hypothetical protein